MRITIDRPRLISALRKLAWFFALWLGGVIAVGGVATVLRFLLHPH